MFVCLGVLAMMSVVANAQFKAGIQGTVMDNAGAVVADASVTLTSKETNQTQQTKSGDSGFYRFSGLAPGLYTITVEKNGFKKQVVENVMISAETLEGVDIALQTGGISETVTVTAESAPLETEDGNIRKTITNQEVQSLPQAGRDPYELARLSPGVFGTGARDSGGGSIRFPNSQGPGGSTNSIFATENAQPISANGQRSSANNYQIDGVSVNSQTWGGAVITPTQESVKEVQVTSSTYSAEDGRNSGAQIKVVSQNGTNRFSGSAFFKLNDPSLNAFNTMPRFVSGVDTGGPKRVERKYKSFGGSLGGPILKDRLFFFFAYEGMRENTSNTFKSLIETSAFRQSIVGARANTLIARILSTSGIEPRVAQILTPSCTGITADCQLTSNGMDVGSIVGTYGTYAPTFTGTTRGSGFDGIADFQWANLVNPYSFRGNQFNTRIDYQITQKDRFTVSSYIVPFNQTAANGDHQSRPQSDVISKRLSFSLGFIYNRTISTNMVNEARFNITRWGFDEVTSNPSASFGLPRVQIEGLWDAGRIRMGFPRDINTPGVINEKQFDFRDMLTWVKGNQVFKFGVEYRRDLNSNSEVGGARPDFSFVRPWNFANGTPIYEGITATLDGTPTTNNIKFKTSEIAAFVQDDWKFRPNLTLNLGLRWSIYTPITATNGVLGNLQLGPDGGLAAAKIVATKELYDKDWNNFGPQLGFAWSPERFKNKLVIRGGGGIGYDRLGNNVLAAARRNPPNGALFGICCATAGVGAGEPDWAAGPFVGGQISFVASSDGTIYGYPRNPILGAGTRSNGLPVNGSVEIWGSNRYLPSASVYRYSLEGQYELPSNLTATLGYQGSQGRHFVRIDRVRIVAPNQNPNLGGVYFAAPDVNTNYNALIARLQGRFMKQFSFDTNYRWSKSIDTSSYEGASGNADQTYPIDQKEERGPSDFDVRHSFIASGIWDIQFFKDQKSLAGRLLGGWQVSGIMTWNGGFPWTPLAFGCLGGSTSNSDSFCDPRPTSYNGTQPASNTNANFLRTNGIFGVPGTQVFNFTPASTSLLSRPGIGRNRFRGPRYFSLDMALSKRIGLENVWFFGETASVDVRFNFFNILNNLNLAPFISRNNNTRFQSAEFGTVTSGLAGRVGEFQIRFNF
ncbi:MAG: TonB-dependent receptor [Acidobacteria bacterium]|nr:TonB-dependent receptor [Acidobacteriota bacterium]